MEIILLEYIEKVGDKHEVVKVRNGYGRNYLIPKGLAIVANKSNMARLDGLKKQFAKKEAAKIDIYRGYAEKLASATLQIVAKAGETGRLFGSVKAQNLIDAIKEKFGFEVERRVIQMPEEVKDLGSYEAIFKFHEEVVVTVKFDVVRDKNVAELGGTKANDGTVATDVRAAAPVVEAEAPAVVEEPVVAAGETAAEAEVAEAAPAEPEAAAEEVAAEPEPVVEETPAPAEPEAVVEETVEAVAEVADEVEETVEAVAAEVEETVEEAAAEVTEEVVAEAEETPATDEDDTEKAA